MFTNLIESDSHLKELKRRSSFFLGTVAAYSLILFAAGIASIYAYDARLETQSSGLIIDYWIPPVKPAAAPEGPQPAHRTTASNSNRTSLHPTRPIPYEDASNPIRPPDRISTDPNPIPPALPDTIIRLYVSDPPIPPTSTGCLTCNG